MLIQRRMYERRKSTLRNHFKKFISTDDMFQLVQLCIIAETILTENEFPTKKYIKWLRTLKTKK